MEKPAVPFLLPHKTPRYPAVSEKKEYVLEYLPPVVFCIYEAQRKNQGPPDFPVV